MRINTALEHNQDRETGKYLHLSRNCVNSPAEALVLTLTELKPFDCKIVEVSDNGAEKSSGTRWP